MKSGLVWNWKALLVVAGIPFVAASLHAPLSYGEDDPQVNTNAVTTNALLAPAGMETNVIAPAEPPAAGTNAAKPSAPTMPDLKFNEAAVGLVKLVQSGVSDDVMQAYIANANSRFSLTSDQIIYMHDLGVSPGLVTAMIEHDTAFDAEVARILAQNQTTVAELTTPPAAAYNQEPPPVSAPAIDFTGYTDVAPVNYSAEDVNYFYDSLAPYGSWVYVAGYGLCWQPTVYARNRDWRPYCDRGRWLYTDCGWYWQSDYSWGWAPFHYGRWYCDTGRGWVWCPNRVWSPAWVSWRQSAGYCGWAPLPPWANYGLSVGFTFGGHGVNSGFEFGLSYGCYNFVPVERFCDYSPSRYCLPGSQSAQVFQQTTVINDVSVQNRRVFNRGIDPGQVETASRTPVRRAVVQETPIEGGRRNQTDRLERRGDSLVVVSPQLPARGQRGVAGREPATRGAAPSGNAGRGESVLLPSPRNTTTGGRVAFSDRTQPNGNRGTAATATPTDSENRSRVQVHTRPDSATRGSSASSSTTDAAAGARGETYPPNSLILSGRRNGAAAQSTASGSSQTLYLPNRSAIEPASPAAQPAGRGNESSGIAARRGSGTAIPRDGTFQTSGPAMVPPSSRESTAFTLRISQPTIVSAQPGPATPNVNRGGYNAGVQPSQNYSSTVVTPTAPVGGYSGARSGAPAQNVFSLQGNNNNAGAAPSTTSPGAGYQGRGSFGSSLNRGSGGLQSREANTRIAPSQSPGEVMVPSRSTGGGSYSRGNSSAPANNYSAPVSPPRSQPAAAPVYTPRSEPVVRQPSAAPSAPSTPSPAARATTSESRSAPASAPSVPSRSSGSSGSSDSGRSAPSSSRGGR